MILDAAEEMPVRECGGAAARIAAEGNCDATAGADARATHEPVAAELVLATVAVATEPQPATPELMLATVLWATPELLADFPCGS